jgi:Protein of unknown function (DUF1647)
MTRSRTQFRSCQRLPLLVIGVGALCAIVFLIVYNSLLKTIPDPDAMNTFSLPPLEQVSIKSGIGAGSYLLEHQEDYNDIRSYIASHDIGPVASAPSYNQVLIIGSSLAACEHHNVSHKLFVQRCINSNRWAYSLTHEYEYIEIDKMFQQPEQPQALLWARALLYYVTDMYNLPRDYNMDRRRPMYVLWMGHEAMFAPSSLDMSIDVMLPPTSSMPSKCNVVGHSDVPVAQAVLMKASPACIALLHNIVNGVSDILLAPRYVADLSSLQPNGTLITHELTASRSQSLLDFAPMQVPCDSASREASISRVWKIWYNTHHRFVSSLNLLSKFDMASTVLSEHLGPLEQQQELHHSLPAVIAVGASQNHLRTLRQYLTSVLNETLESEFQFIVYDLGIWPPDHATLQQDFPAITFRQFQFDNYPDYFDIRVEAGCYAWKPAIMSDLVREFGFAVWLDSGCLFTRDAAKEFVERNARDGFASRSYAAQVHTWTHPGTLRYFHIPEKAEILGARTLSGGLHGSHLYSPALTSVAIPFWRCAMTKHCIAPEGSSRKNHRQDQSALTLLGHMSGYHCSYTRIPGLEVHKDISGVTPASDGSTHKRNFRPCTELRTEKCDKAN